MAPATFCIAGVPVSERSTSHAKYAATRTAMTPEIGTTHNRGEASNEKPSTADRKVMDKNQAPAPTEGAAALSVSLRKRARVCKAPYRSTHAPTESLEERTEGRRVGEGQGREPRLAHHRRARYEDRLARARITRCDARQGSARRAPHRVRLSHRRHGG